MEGRQKDKGKEREWLLCSMFEARQQAVLNISRASLPSDSSNSRIRKSLFTRSPPFPTRHDTTRHDTTPSGGGKWNGGDVPAVFALRVALGPAFRSRAACLCSWLPLQAASRLREFKRSIKNVNSANWHVKRHIALKRGENGSVTWLRQPATFAPSVPRLFRQRRKLRRETSPPSRLMKTKNDEFSRTIGTVMLIGLATRSRSECRDVGWKLGYFEGDDPSFRAGGTRVEIFVLAGVRMNLHLCKIHTTNLLLSFPFLNYQM